MPAPEEVFDDDMTSKSPEPEYAPQPEYAPLTSPTKEAPPPPWKRRRREDFRGDVAVAALRSRLALTPERVPDPPLSATPRRRLVLMTRWALAATAVGVAAAWLWQFKLSSRDLLPGAAHAVLTQDPAATLSPAESRAAVGVAAADTRAETRPTSAGAATSSDAPQPSAAARAQTVAPAVPPPPTAEQAPLIAAKMKIGVELVTYGEIVAARLIFQRAAEAGDGAGAFALAETYDPLVLEEWRLREKITPNVALARAWYERARDLGSPEARDRISRLAQLPR